MRRFYREKKIHCDGSYMEVDIYPYTSKQQRVSKSRRHRKKKVTAPKQRNLNDKNARRYLTQLANTNFDRTDLHVTCTYDNAHLPDSIAEAEREARNYIRRIAYRRKKERLDPIQYILVSEYGSKKGSEDITRIHHHIIMNGGLDRDVIEGLWKKKRKRLGRANADRLQPDENGVAALCAYLTKNPNGKKRWSSSHNLKKPHYTTNDHKYSNRQIEKAAMNYDPDYWIKKYPGYKVIPDYGYNAQFNDLTGWSIYLKLRKVE